MGSQFKVGNPTEESFYASIKLDKPFAADTQFYVDGCNGILGELNESLKHHNLPSFGGGMLSGNSSNTIVSATIAHRVRSKFCVPDQSKQSALGRACSKDWVEFESNLASHDFYKSIADAGEFRQEVKFALYKAREQLHEWFKGFKPGKAVEITPGETFISQKGHVSIRAKLQRKSHWTVTEEAADDFIRLVYNTRWLKKCAKRFFKPLTRQEYFLLYAKTDENRHIGFQVFSFRMREELLTIVYGSRGSSVPKNNEKRRFINVEPLGNVILQRTVASTIRSVLASHGNNLNIGQDVHKSRIASNKVSTIDFSNASDSVLTSVCEFLFPTSLMKYLHRYRSEFVLVDGMYYMPHKLSSMGNGFTFEVMTVILLAIARTLDKCATVYGDDVIIANEHADSFVRATRCIAFNVNQVKSFINAPFRESCGAFYLDGYGYITCYDFHFCENMQDVIITANKLRRVIQDNPGLVITPDFRAAYAALLRLIPALFKGPVSSNTKVLKPEWVEDDLYMRRHMKGPRQRGLFKKLMSKHRSEVLSKTSVFNCHTDWVLIAIPYFEPELSYETLKSTRSTSAIASYLYSNRVTDAERRNHGEWKMKLCFVSPYHSIYEPKELDEIQLTKT